MTISLDYNESPPVAFQVADATRSAEPTPVPSVTINTDPAKASAIAQMVAKSDAPAPSVAGVGGRIPTNSSDSLRIDTGTGAITVLAKAGNPSARLIDGPELDPAQDMQRIQDQIASVEQRLAENLYDRKTGQPSPLYTGKDRDGLQLQLASLRNALAYSQQRAVALLVQREQDFADRQQHINEDFARNNFTRGDAAREEALRAALLQAEAEDQARAIVSSRKR